MTRIFHVFTQSQWDTGAGVLLGLFIYHWLEQFIGNVSVLAFKFCERIYDGYRIVRGRRTGKW